MNLRKVFPGLFVLGVLIMVPFEMWYTRLVGMACLIAFVVVGTFVIASPEFLQGDAEAEADPKPAPVAEER